MEATGVVLGVAGLAGLFSTCIDCFHLVHRGCAFDRDYRILETKFDNQELRLYAWGRACGLISCNAIADSNGGGFESTSTILSNNSVLDEPQLQCRVKQTLECIKVLFEDEKELTRRYGLEPCIVRDESVTTLGGVDQRLIGDASAASVSGSEPSFSRSRPGLFFSWKRKQRSIGFRGSARWAICDRDKFSDLVQHLKDFNDDLESMTRAMEIPWRQRIIVEYEIEEVEDTETLEEIEEAGAGDADVVSDTASVRLERIREGSSIGSASIRTLSIRTATATITTRNSGSFVTARSSLALSDDGTNFSILDENLDDLVEEAINPGPKPITAVPRRISGIFQRPEGPIPRYKCVALGDKGCYSTELFSAFTVKIRATHYQPTQFKEYTTHCSLDGNKLGLELWDTAGLEDYYHLRKRVYQGANVLLLCLQTSLAAHQTTISTLVKWSPEFKDLCPDVPIIVVGIDNPESSINKQRGPGSGTLFVTNPDFDHLDPVKEFERLALARRIGAVGYIRCDLLSRESVDAVFELAARTVSGIPGRNNNRLGKRFRRLSNFFSRLKPIVEASDD